MLNCGHGIRFQTTVQSFPNLCLYLSQLSLKIWFCELSHFIKIYDKTICSAHIFRRVSLLSLFQHVYKYRGYVGNHSPSNVYYLFIFTSSKQNNRNRQKMYILNPWYVKVVDMQHEDALPEILARERSSCGCEIRNSGLIKDEKDVFWSNTG